MLNWICLFFFFFFLLLRITAAVMIVYYIVTMANIIFFFHAFHDQQSTVEEQRINVRKGAVQKQSPIVAINDSILRKPRSGPRKQKPPLPLPMRLQSVIRLS